MARLEATDGRWFELTPVSYQYPGLRTSVWDANWLNIAWKWDFGAGRRVRIKVDPDFLTWELRSIVRFCRAAAEGSTAPGESYEATERFQFKLLASHSKTIRLALDFHGLGRVRPLFERERLVQFANDLEFEAAALPVIDIPE